MPKIKKRILIPLLFILSAGLFLKTNYQVPVLMYHHVDFPDDQTPGMFVTPATFERQMEFLKIHKYHVLSLVDYVRKVKMGEDIPAKSVVLTFDDGFADNFTHAFPVLKGMGFPATVFMITENIGKDDWLSEEDLKIMDESGIAIGSHTVTHAFLPKVESEEELIREIVDSKKCLEELLGHSVPLFSYPAGGFTTKAREKVVQAGYEAAVTTNHGKKRGDLFGVHRIKIKESGGNLFNFWIKTSGFYHLGKKRIEVV